MKKQVSIGSKLPFRACAYCGNAVCSRLTYSKSKQVRCIAPATMNGVGVINTLLSDTRSGNPRVCPVRSARVSCPSFDLRDDHNPLTTVTNGATYFTPALMKNLCECAAF